MADADTIQDTPTPPPASPPMDIQTPSLNLLGRLGLILQPGQNGAENLLKYNQQQATAQLGSSPQWQQSGSQGKLAILNKIYGDRDLAYRSAIPPIQVPGQQGQLPTTTYQPQSIAQQAQPAPGISGPQQP